MRSVSFTPGFSPVIKDGMMARTVLTVYSAIRSLEPLNGKKLHHQFQEKRLKRFLILCGAGAPG
jgi:hypothetical protein